MGNQKILRAYRLRKGFTQGQFAKILNVHRNTVANYESGRSEVPEMVKRRFEVMDGKAKESETKTEGIITMNQQNMLIEYQQKEIEQLKKRVEHHKSTPVQETVWNQLEFDFRVEVKLGFENFTMGRSILSITNAELQSKILGYNVNELEKLWDTGTYYKNSGKHPVDKLLNNHTLKGIKERIKSLPLIFEQLKNMMGNHYIPQPLTYVCKDKSFVNAIAYNKVNWKDKTVSSKVKFLLND